MRLLILSSAALLLCSAACASGGSKPPANAAKPAPKPRPPRRIGVGPGQRPGQAELESAIKAAKGGDLDLAIKRSNDAIEKNPNLEHAYLLLGSSCAMKQDLDCERAAYERGLEALPRSAALKRELGLWYLQQGDIPKAVTNYEAAHELSGGKDAGTMADLAYAYVYAGRLDEAETLAARAVKLDGKCFTCAMSLGQARLTKRDFAGAVEAYESARTLEPKSSDAQHSLAKAYFLAGKHDEAARLYEDLIRARPDDYRLRVQTAQVAMARKRYREAVEHLQVVAEANPKQKPLLELLLQAQTKAKDRKGAAATKKKLRRLGGK